MRAVHAMDEFSRFMRVHPRRGDEQRPGAVTAEHGDCAPSHERGLRYADYGLRRAERHMQPRAQPGSPSRSHTWPSMTTASTG